MQHIWCIVFYFLALDSNKTKTPKRRQPQFDNTCVPMTDRDPEKPILGVESSIFVIHSFDLVSYIYHTVTHTTHKLNKCGCYVLAQLWTLWNGCAPHTRQKILVVVVVVESSPPPITNSSWNSQQNFPLARDIQTNCRAFQVLPPFQNCCKCTHTVLGAKKVGSCGLWYKSYVKMAYAKRFQLHR